MGNRRGAGPDGRENTETTEEHRGATEKGRQGTKRAPLFFSVSTSVFLSGLCGDLPFETALRASSG
jgi:hypothetical protein